MEEEKKYTKQSLVERFLKRVLTSEELGLLPMYIQSASTQIDLYTGRTFIDIDDDAPEPGIYVYDGNGENELFIDDFTSITKVEYLDSYGDLLEEIPSGDYIRFPQNASYINSIRLRNRRFPKGVGRVQITGIASSGELPKVVQHVATTLVARWIMNANIESNKFDSESIEGYSYKHSKPGNTMLDDSDPLASLLGSLVKINF